MPTPQVGITHSDILTVGTNTTLTCTVTTKVSGLDTTVNVEWYKSELLLHNHDNRVTISEVSKVADSFISKLILSPLSAQDANINCSATGTLVASSPFISESLPGSTSLHLPIEGRT